MSSIHEIATIGAMLVVGHSRRGRGPHMRDFLAVHRGAAEGSARSGRLVLGVAAMLALLQAALPALADPQQPKIDEFGVASVYYAWDSGGRIAANGEHIDHAALTAAHKTLPLGEYVRIINRENGKNAIVRINDRGPYVAGRVIDLTAGAARALGVDGLADVEVKLAPCLFAERFSAALWVDRNAPRLGCPKKN
jgi:rare lipoprotein A (peptidoglycan hydrolase)